MNNFKKATKMRRAMRNRFKTEVRNLKTQCDTLGLRLYTWDENPPSYFVCVLSSDEYEIGNTVDNCSMGNEAYFLNEIDYEYFQEQQ